MLVEFLPQLIEILPMDDTTFISELFTANLLPGNLKAEIKSLATPADKADYFLDRVVFPNIDNDRTNFDKLLSVLKKSNNDAVKNVATEVTRAIN